jgi:preprotein translocase subunit YajC
MGDLFKDPTTLLMLAVVAVLVVFMIRNNRKRKRDAAEMATKFVPGAEVMTSFGLYGTLLSVNEEENTVVLETSPKVSVKLHRQAIARVVTEAPAKKAAPKVSESNEAPAFGERTTQSKPAAKPAAKKAPAKPETNKPAAKPAAK